MDQTIESPRVLLPTIRRPSDAIRLAAAIIEKAVGVAQLAEHRTVAPTVAGSIPVSHPNFQIVRLPFIFQPET